ncbi:MAG: dethiobiotin synthase [Planctomycetia bacterium]|nr:dethiobiotin synthase [Planctomycetia bacterium]
MKGLFFTGTDTGVGKTVVTAQVARWLRAQGQPVRVCKPVATGGRPVAGGLLCEDTEQLAAAVGHAQTADEITPWAFAEPVAPPVAARLAGKPLTLADLISAVRANVRPDALLLVEGVGGLLCPLTERATVADLLAELGLPAVVVARRSLGTLNHTLLTLEVARGRGLPVAGVVVSETTPPHDLADQTNIEELRRRIDVPLLAVVPWRTPDEDEIPAALAAVDWRRLCAGERVRP